MQVSVQRTNSHDTWSTGASYDHYMGRWSSKVAQGFLDWLQPPAGVDWLETGCGTGALTAQILARCAPRSVHASDPSADFVAHAKAAVTDPRVVFATAGAAALPVADASVDVVTSGLVLNFVPDRVAALREMKRVLRRDGILSFYVWAYPDGGVGFIDAFWKAAAALDPAAAVLDEGERFPFCSRHGLAQLCVEAGIDAPEVAALDIVTEFPDFEAFWQPFTLGTGPAPGYCASLAEAQRAALKASLRQQLDRGAPLRFNARALMVKCRV